MKVEIFQSEYRLGYAVLMYRELPGDRIEVLHFSEEGEERYQVVEHGAKYEPSFYLRVEELKALGDAIAGMGIKLDSDMKREGILEATKYHLEDMRKLVFGKG